MASIEADWIDLVLSRAIELRRAGVLAIGCDGHIANFAPYIAPIEKSSGIPDQADEPQMDALDAVLAAAYPGGDAPGYQIQRFEPVDPED